MNIIVKNPKIVSLIIILMEEIIIEADDSTSHNSLKSPKFLKMVFLCNAIEDGWSIKKRKNEYIFTKNHEGKKKVYNDSYLSTFMKDNTQLNNNFS